MENAGSMSEAMFETERRSRYVWKEIRLLFVILQIGGLR